jgi:molybdate transport system substrate-binding protein
MYAASPNRRAARWLATLAFGAMANTMSAQAQTPLSVYAAGSLRAVMLDLGAAFEAGRGAKVEFTFGPSGVLRERIEGGAPADVFASADMDHPRRLADAGRSYPAVAFANNRLCALASPKIPVSESTFLDRILDPAVKVGMSTPVADPSGDYALQLFDKAEQLRAGARKTLTQKARRLVGGPDAPVPPKDRSVYAMLVTSGEADIFLTYCTNALLAQKEDPGLQVVQIPDALAVSAQYGLTVMKSARPEAARFAEFVLSPRGQQTFARHGFTPVSR